jgi:hypothetical protein
VLPVVGVVKTIMKFPFFIPQDFVCGDPKLSFPKKPDTVKNWMLDYLSLSQIAVVSKEISLSRQFISFTFTSSCSCAKLFSTARRPKASLIVSRRVGITRRFWDFVIIWTFTS